MLQGTRAEGELVKDVESEKGRVTVNTIGEKSALADALGRLEETPVAEDALVAVLLVSGMFELTLERAGRGAEM